MIRRLLNQDAKNWWYHKQLRSYGNHTEARQREHQSIRNHVQYLRETLTNGGFATVGRGGWSLHIADGHTLSGYGDSRSEPMIQACIRLGIPVCDSTTVSDERIAEVIPLPMAGIQRSDKDFPRMFQTLPFREVFSMYAELGATIIG